MENKKILVTLKTLLHLGTHLKFINTVNYAYNDNLDYLNTIKLTGHYENISFSKAVSGNLQNYAIIIACSFLDELNKELTAFNHPDYEKQINKVKRIIKPIKKRINKWSDLRNYRNYILAHNLKEKSISLFSEKREKVTYNVPFSNSEHFLFTELILMIVKFVSSEFKDLIAKIDFKESITDRVEFTENDVDVKKEYYEIYELCTELKKTVANNS